MKQGSLFQLSQPVEPSAARADPAIWIRRLMIVESLDPSARTIRDISFRCGLNIVRTAERTPDESRPVGHSVGKTLLLRLIRYCLGESTFSTRIVRSAIAEKLPHAYALAEVCLAGEWWAVARPIGMDHSISASRAVRSDDVAAVRHESAEPPRFSYLAAIEAMSKPWFVDMELPSANHPPRWLDLLAWLARDQHCRMRHALEWRDPESESGTAPLAREDASLLIRMVMGLLSEDERKLRDRHSILLNEQSQLNQQAQLLTARLEGIETDLREGLGIPDDSPRGSLLGPVAVDAAEEKIASLQGLLTELRAKSAVAELEAKARELAVAAGVIEKLRSSLQGTLDVARAELRQLEEADANVFLATFAQQERWCHLFQTKSEAVSKGCPGEPPALAPGARDPRHQQRINDTTTQVSELLTQIVQRDKELVACQSEARQADARRQAAQDQLDAQVAGAREQIGRFTVMLERATQLGRLWDDLGRLENQLESKAKSIDTSNKKQEKAREQLATALGTLSGHFDATLKELLGVDAGGKIEIDSRVIFPRPNANVAASGAALGTSATVLGFDVACLIASVCGLGNHPRLVLHDSPREADMEELMYHRLFNLIAAVEAAFGKRPPSFQYIVTTTTPPPKNLSDEPYVRLTLDARSDDGLLLLTRLLV